MELRSWRVATARLEHRHTPLRWNVHVFDYNIIAARSHHPVDVPGILDGYLRDGQGKPSGIGLALMGVLQCPRNHPVPSHITPAPPPPPRGTVPPAAAPRAPPGRDNGGSNRVRGRGKLSPRKA